MDKIKEGHQLFHAFCLRPKIEFEGQSSKEEIIFVLRAHPVTQIYWVINGFILLIILILLNLILPGIFTGNQVLFINLLGLLTVFGYFWYNFLSWYFNVGIGTDHRVIDIDFHSLLYKEVTIALLEKVEDVTSKTSGFFSAIFNYGNVFLQTAGTEANIEFMNIPRPALIVKIVNQLVHH